MKQTISTPLLLLLLVVMAIMVMRSFINEGAAQAVTDRYFGPNDIRGSAIVYQGKSYTFNFLQQTRFVDFLNKTLVVNSLEPHPARAPFDKIIVYLFGGQEIELTPVDISGDNDIYFSAPALQKNGYLQDVTQGRLMQLLEGSYGP